MEIHATGQRAGGPGSAASEAGRHSNSLARCAGERHVPVILQGLEGTPRDARRVASRGPYREIVSTMGEGIVKCVRRREAGRASRSSEPRGPCGEGHRTASRRRPTVDALLLGLAAAAAGLQSLPHRRARTPRRVGGERRLSGPRGARDALARSPWLLRATREDEENGERLRAWLDVTSESPCAISAAGTATTRFRWPRRSDRKGVFAVDLQPEMLDLLAERADELGLTNLVPVEATVDDPRLRTPWTRS